MMKVFTKTRRIGIAASALFGLVLALPDSAPAQEVLLAIDEGSNPDGNQSIIDRLTNEFGLDVTVVDDNQPSNPTADLAEGKAFVIISSTVLSTNLGTAFTDQDPLFRSLEIPTIQWEQALHDEFLFADSGRGVDNSDSIEITGEGHPLAAGLSAGVHQIRDEPTTFHTGSDNNLAPGYQVIGLVDGSPALGIVEAGGLLNDGTTTASARRIDLFFGDPALDGVNETGLAIFDAAVNLALGLDMQGIPGDFNGDGSVDVADFEILAGNFSLQGVGFEEGDMDFNRRIDLKDFVKFVEVFNAGNAAAVPEPSSALLAISVFILLGFTARTRRGFHFSPR